MPSAQATGKRGGGAGRTSVSQSWKATGHFFRLHLRPWYPAVGTICRIWRESGAPGRIRTCDPRLRRPCVGSVINGRLSPTSPRGSGSREFTPILAALRRFIASHAITDRRDDHVNVGNRTRSRPGGARVPLVACRLPSPRPPPRARVRAAIIEDLHTIADLRDPDQIRRDSDAGATRWPRGGAGVGRFHASREREVP